MSHRIRNLAIKKNIGSNHDQVQCTFDEVAIYFSKEEWDCLTSEEKDMYRDVMLENYQALSLLGLISMKPPLVSAIERGEETFIKQINTQKVPRISSAAHLFLSDGPTKRDPERQRVTLSASDSVREHHQNPVFRNPLGKSERNYAEDAGGLNSHPGQKLPPSPLPQKGDTREAHQDIHVKQDSSNGPEAQSKQTMAAVMCNLKEMAKYSHNESVSSGPATRLRSRNLSAGKGLDKPENIDIDLVGKQKKPIECQDCGKCFTLTVNLIRHRKCHTGKGTWPCPECEKVCWSNIQLVRHLTTHTAVRPHLCSECGKSFKEKASFYNHLRIHTGEKPFACKECEKRFTCYSNLLRHIKVHTGEKPFPCSECGKSFATNPHLIRHQRIHTGVKPFSCSECGRCFTNDFHLLRHCRALHAQYY